jgi:hypothetical protein
VLEIVEGEAIGWSSCAQAKRSLNGGCHALGARQHGFGPWEKPHSVVSLCRGLDRGTKGALTFDLRPQDAGLRPSMGPS